MLGLDQNGGYVLSAFLITVVVLVGYALYLRSRLLGLRRRAAHAPDAATSAQDPLTTESRLSTEVARGS